MVGMSNLKKDFAQRFSTHETQGKAAVEFIFDKIAEYLAAGETVAIRNFGNFKPQITSARTVRNLQTNEKVNIPASIRAKFVAGKALKVKMAGGISVEDLKKKQEAAKHAPKEASQEAAQDAPAAQ